MDDGPDRIIAVENLSTTKPDGSVKIRETAEDVKIDPKSLVTFATKQVHIQILSFFNFIYFKTKMIKWHFCNIKLQVNPMIFFFCSLEQILLNNGLG